jgi:hypothetical protein
MPAAKLAHNFTVQPLLAHYIEEYRTYILADPSLAAVYAPKGVPLKVLLFTLFVSFFIGFFFSLFPYFSLFGSL